MGATRRRLGSSFTMITALVMAAAAIAPVASAFRFNATSPKQCGDWTVTWDGGTAPFYLVMVPTITVTAGRIINMSLPADGSSVPYSHTFTLQQPEGLEFIATMYDADGFGSGGASEVLSVGSSSDTSCLNSTVNADFYFSTSPESSPDLCEGMTITWNSDAVDPVNLYGIVPGGTAWEVPISSSQMSSRSVDWTVDVAAGTTFLLLMSDAGTYGTGGSSALMTTSNSSSGSSSCINSSSPSTTPVVPWTYAATATAVSSFTSTQSTSKGQTTANPSSSAATESSAASSKKSNTGVIVGAAVGVSLAVLLALLLFCCCRRRRNKDVEGTAPGAWAPVKEEREGSNNNDRTSGGGPTAPTAPTVNERQGLLDRLFTAGVPSIGISSHSRTGSRAPSGSAADTLNRGSRDLSAIAGMPYGAPAPSVFTSDSHSEIIEVSPYPYTEYSDHPPPFSAHERRRSASSTDKVPLSDAQNSSTDNSNDNSNDTNPENPFRDSSDHPPTLPPVGSSTPLSPVLDDDEIDAEAVRRKTALSMGGVTRATGMRTSDLLTLSEFPAPAVQGTTPSSSASNGDGNPRNSVHSAEHWMALTSDPPPSYNPYDRLRAANPDDHADDRSEE